jgi:glycosyltransferase involved in cell wall biosynthesis
VTPVRRRLAFVVSHPIQYYAPLYRRLAQRDDLAVKVYFTWHAGAAPVHDRGFNAPVAWDIPLTKGYEYELVPNLAKDRGSHRFFGLRNPTLVDRVLEWKPDVVHVTGWAWASHLHSLRSLRRRGIPTLFRGDSHLLDARRSGIRWYVKRAVLQRIFAWPTGFLVVGVANRTYYQAFGVDADRLFACPHSIDVRRFAEPASAFEDAAAQWRVRLGIGDAARVVLFAGKFERKKSPLELMRAVRALEDRDVVLVLVGGGELQRDIDALAATDATRFRVLPFQNQSRMPVVYRLGDLFVLPSAYGETWGIAVTEALACGRPVLVSDRVGCATDVVDDSCGRVFSWDNPQAMTTSMTELLAERAKLDAMGDAAASRAWRFDIASTEASLVAAVEQVVGKL